MLRFGRSLLPILISVGIAYSSSGAAQPGEPKPQPPVRARHATINGKFAHYLKSPKGDIDGIVLEDGTIARFPPHAITSDTTELRPGDGIRVEGDAEDGPAGRVIAHASVTKSNVVIVRAETPPPPLGGPDAILGPHRGGKHGPKDDKDPGEENLQPMTVMGKIQGFSTDLRGKVDGHPLGRWHQRSRRKEGATRVPWAQSWRHDHDHGQGRQLSARKVAPYRNGEAP